MNQIIQKNVQPLQKHIHLQLPDQKGNFCLIKSFFILNLVVGSTNKILNWKQYLLIIIAKT